MLPVPERARVTAADIEQPVALPFLGKQAPERPSPQVTTLDAATAAVLLARALPVPLPRRTVLAPLGRRRPVTLAVPPELTDPWTATPQTPGR
jgi:hypothetical protein